MRAAARARSAERKPGRTRARAHNEMEDLCAVFILFFIRVSDRDPAAVLAALKLELARRLPVRGAR